MIQRGHANLCMMLFDLAYSPWSILWYHGAICHCCRAHGVCEAGSPSWRMGLFCMDNNLISQVHHPTSNLPSLSPSPVFVLHVVLECLQQYEVLPPQKSSFAELVAAAMKGPDKP